jgi:hypothetical protein
MNPSALAQGNGTENWKSDSGSEGRLLTKDETEAYNKAVAKLATFFESSELVWTTNPTGAGLYLISHLNKPQLEAVLVSGSMHLKLYNPDEKASYNTEISALWLGPLPLSPTIRRVSANEY